MYVRGLGFFALSIILVSVEASHFGKYKRKDCNVKLLSGDKTSVTEKGNFPANVEHKGSAIGKHLTDQHGRDPNDISRRFQIVRKCQSKYDCLIYEMLFMKELIVDKGVKYVL